MKEYNHPLGSILAGRSPISVAPLSGKQTKGSVKAFSTPIGTILTVDLEGKTDGSLCLRVDGRSLGSFSLVEREESAAHGILVTDSLTPSELKGCEATLGECPLSDRFAEGTFS